MSNQRQESVQEEYEEEMYSQEDQDANLLTDKVQCKLLQIFAKIKAKDPSIYQKKDNIFDDSDFMSEQSQPATKQKKDKKFTYKDMLTYKQSSGESDQQLAPALEEKKAKNLFKKAIQSKTKNIQENDDLFVVKVKISKKKDQEVIEKDENQKFQDLTKKLNKQSKKLLKKVWQSEKLDETDLFLKNYILDKKWLSQKYKQKQAKQNEIMDDQDEERSVQMDEYESQYNFRFEQPGGSNIVQYPRGVQESLRIKPENRKTKRKKVQQRKQQQQLELNKQAAIKRKLLKQTILNKLNYKQVQQDQLSVGHDWFFCDDCCRGLEEGQAYYGCNQCEDYILCQQCNYLIIHKHPLQKEAILEGFGAPTKEKSKPLLQNLKICKICRKRLTNTKIRYEYTDKSYLLNTMCQKCYDESNLQIKKKYKRKEQEIYNYEQLIQSNPEKIKQLTNIKEIEEMVDEYMKNEFEDVIGGGLKTKFRYINVKPESYGLSDEQILFGEDKELNKYISIKKLAPYSQDYMKLRNSHFVKKSKDINRSVNNNKKIIQKGQAKLLKIRYFQKIRQRASAVKQRRTKKLKILNLSTSEAERNHFVSSSRLLSYGIVQKPQQRKA